MQTIYDLAVIGGGPGGISAVVEAKVAKMDKIIIIEKGDNHSQTIRKFYKEQKRVDKDYKGQVVKLEGHVEFSDGTKESTLDFFDELLDNDMIDYEFNCEVENIKKQDGIFQIITSTMGVRARNVIVAIGKMGKPNKPSYKIPPSIRQLVNFNLDRCSKGEDILVVGGGNSATEYALELSRTNVISLNYRREKFVRLNDINENELMQKSKDGEITLILGKDIKELQGNSGKVKVVFEDDTSRSFDRIIYAIGGTTPVDFLKKCGITLDEKNHPIYDKDSYETKEEGMYIAGDIVVASGGSIALALNHSYKIIEDIVSKRER